MPCSGYLALFIPMVLIAFLLTVVFVAEFLRRERTTTKEDDWVQFHKHDESRASCSDVDEHD